MTRRRQAIEVRRQQYLRTQNPVFVWSALELLLRDRQPLPAWVRDYLARVATNIDTLSRRRIPRKNEPPRAVYRALEFGKHGAVVNPFAAQADEWHRLNIAIEVWWRLGALEKLDAAIFEVVNTHAQFCTRRPPCRRISRSTVMRAWEAYKRDVTAPTDLPDP